MFAFVLLCNPIFSQSKSKEALGNSLVTSILNDDIDSFKSLLLPKSVALKYQENLDLEVNNTKVRDSLMAQYESAYDQIIVPGYEKNFEEIVNITKMKNIDWSNPSYIILYKASSVGEEYIPFFIHTTLNNSDDKHFYFGATRYKGEWYLSCNMDITKEEKYAPK
jgi:hypothetical protein